MVFPCKEDKSICIQSKISDQSGGNMAFDEYDFLTDFMRTGGVWT